MALAVRFFVLSACALSAMANDVAIEGCSSQARSIWDILKKDVEYDMLRWNLDTKFGSNITCLSSTTTAIEKGKLEVGQRVTYLENGENRTIYQEYLVDATDNKTMETTRYTSLPHARYTFDFVGENCAVVKVTDVNGLDSTASKRSDGKAQEKYYTLWVKHSDVRQPEECCEKYFKAKCSGTTQEVYDPNKCNTGS
uniref:Lipocalin n=1 Tax=Rhipicephalus zambeziensis TaxID=60191 RepID=A0A224YNG3_9ACAR